MIYKRSTALERSVKYFIGGFKPVSWRAKLNLSSDVDQDIFKEEKHLCNKDVQDIEEQEAAEDSPVFVCLFVWFLTTHQPLWVISVRRY